MNSLQLVLIALICLVLKHLWYIVILELRLTTACQPGPTPTLQQKIDSSHAVVTGEVSQRFSSKSLQFTVSCVLKDRGYPIAEIINITGVADKNSARCFRNNLQVGHQYILFLRRVITSYRPVAQEESITQLPIILQTCGLGAIGPQSKSTTSNSQCSELNLDSSSTSTTTTEPLSSSFTIIETTTSQNRTNGVNLGNGAHHRFTDMLMIVFLLAVGLT